MCDRHSYTQRDVERLVLGVLLERGVAYVTDCDRLGTISDYVDAELRSIENDCRPLVLDRSALATDLAVPVALDVADALMNAPDLEAYRRSRAAMVRLDAMLAADSTREVCPLCAGDVAHGCRCSVVLGLAGGARS